jgi:hypothetical protein
MSKDFTVTVASDGERDDLFAEICYGDEQWAEVIAAPGGGFTIEVFAPDGAESYRFPLDAFVRAVEEAKDRLIALGYQPGVPGQRRQALDGGAAAPPVVTTR